jgi:hypothetical protein
MMTHENAQKQAEQLTKTDTMGWTFEAILLEENKACIFVYDENGDFVGELGKE